MPREEVHDFMNVFGFHKHWEMSSRKEVILRLSYDHHQTILCLVLEIKATLFERCTGVGNELMSFT